MKIRAYDTKEKKMYDFDGVDFNKGTIWRDGTTYKVKDMIIIGIVEEK